MKTLVVNRNLIVLIISVMLLIYGIQGMSYAQGSKPTVAPGNTNTTLIVSFKGSYYDDTNSPNSVSSERTSRGLDREMWHI